jgi:predicted NUDIX family NTP pyrophosphohydrolase
VTTSSSRTARSAGILLYRVGEADREGGRPPGAERVEVLLVHPGGPFWAKKDEGVWSIPKGEYGPGEDAQAAARREFEEELGTAPPTGQAHDLGEIRQRAGKIVRAFALEGRLDPAGIISNTCEIEWPPRSGRTMTIPEVDRAQWFSVEEARRKILAAQAPLLDRLLERV